MIVTAWNNGKHHDSGAGYGFKLSVPDRDKYFKREWQYVVLYFSGMDDGVKVNINKISFWGDTCSELISIHIGKWLQRHNYAPWPKGSPPKFTLEQISDNKFSVVIIS